MVNYITTHNAQGQAIFSQTIPQEPHLLPMSPDPNNPSSLNIIYSSHTPTPDLSTEDDLKNYAHDRTNGPPPGKIVPDNGFGVSVVTMGPGKSPNHRTMTLDVIYVLEGEIELTLDSGEMKLLHVGDSIVQRGTMHQWNNVTKDGGLARILGVSIAAKEPIMAGGKELKTEWNFE